MSQRPADIDAILEVCRESERRIVLAELAGADRTCSLNELARAIAGATREQANSESPAAVVEEIELSLYHVHMPKLVASGFVEFDADRRVVNSTAQFEQAEPRLTSLLPATVDQEPSVGP